MQFLVTKPCLSDCKKLQEHKGFNILLGYDLPVAFLISKSIRRTINLRHRYGKALLILKLKIRTTMTYNFKKIDLIFLTKF